MKYTRVVKPPHERAAADAAALTAAVGPVVADATRAALVPLIESLNQSGPPPLTVGRKEAADLLSIGLTLLDTMDAAGKLPAAVRIGTRKLWRTDDLVNWVRLGCPNRKRFDALTADPDEAAPRKGKAAKPARRSR